MDNKKVFIVSIIIMIIAIVCMSINWFISPMNDNVIRVTGVILLIDVFILSYSMVKLKNSSN